MFSNSHFLGPQSNSETKTVKDKRKWSGQYESETFSERAASKIKANGASSKTLESLKSTTVAVHEASIWATTPAQNDLYGRSHHKKHVCWVVNSKFRNTSEDSCTKNCALIWEIMEWGKYQQIYLKKMFAFMHIKWSKGEFLLFILEMSTSIKSAAQRNKMTSLRLISVWKYPTLQPFTSVCQIL